MRELRDETTRRAVADITRETSALCTPGRQEAPSGERVLRQTGHVVLRRQALDTQTDFGRNERRKGEHSRPRPTGQDVQHPEREPNDYDTYR